MASTPAAMNVQVAGADRRRSATPGLGASLMVGLLNVVPFGTSVTLPLARAARHRHDWRPPGHGSMLSRNSPDPPDRRTSEEAHLRGRRSVRGDRNRRAGSDG